MIYWKNPRDTGILFGSVLVVLLAVKYVSLIAVVANLALALITSTMAFRIYKSVLSAVNKSQDGHPFKQYLDYDVTLPIDKVQQLVDCGVSKANKLLARLKSILLIEDLVDSLKFAVATYALTYVGKWLNGMTIIVVAWVVIFTAPRLYRDNKIKIDEALKPIKEKIDEVTSKLKSSVPASVSGKKEE